MRSKPERARALARRLIQLEESRARSQASAESAPLEVCYRLHLMLCNSVGSVGCSTLATRALRTAEVDHPVLEELTFSANGRPYFERVPEAIATYDPDKVALGMEAFIVALLDLLARFIGDDVVASLAERVAHADPGVSVEPGDPS